MLRAHCLQPPAERTELRLGERVPRTRPLHQFGAEPLIVEFLGVPGGIVVGDHVGERPIVGYDHVGRDFGRRIVEPVQSAGELLLDRGTGPSRRVENATCPRGMPEPMIRGVAADLWRAP